MRPQLISLLASFLFLVTAFSVHAAKQVYTLDEELMYRINFGTAEDIQILLEKGASPNAITPTGEYAITVAIGRDDSEAAPIIKLLLDKGANPNVLDKSGTPPVISAAVNNKTIIVDYLIAKGADFHAKSVNGRTLLDIAKANNNPDMVKIVQTALDNEAAFIASLHTPEKFMSIIHHYAFDSCAYQYWNFVQGSRQMPEKESAVDDKIKFVKTDISGLIEQIQKYYPTTATGDLQKIANSSAQSIFELLDGMISNNNRARNGVGTEDDANKRCQKISDEIKIEFPPSVYK